MSILVIDASAEKLKNVTCIDSILSYIVMVPLDPPWCSTVRDGCHIGVAVVVVVVRARKVGLGWGRNPGNTTASEQEMGG